MEKRNYRNTGAEISLLGFGCMRLPRIDPEKQDIDFVQAQALIDMAYAQGVNYFDFYLCHSLNRGHWKRLREFGVYEYLEEQKKAGKIRQLGFSFHDKPDLMEEILETYTWDFAQIQLNYLDWDMQNAKRQYELLEAHGLPCIVMEPVRGGALATLSPEAAALLKEADPTRSIASWALRYAASLPNVMTVLSGMSTPEQVQDNLQTMTPFVPLSQEETALVYRAARLYLESRTVPCTACRYCMDCPAGVDIPLMFQIFNRFKMTENGADARSAFAAAGEEKQAAHCVSCRKCTQHCPQLIDIPARLKEVEELAQRVSR